MYNLVGMAVLAHERMRDAPAVNRAAKERSAINRTDGLRKSGALLLAGGLTALALALLALLTASHTASASKAALVATSRGEGGHITITITDSTADFGTNLTPGGTVSSSTDVVASYTDSAGAYYVWKAAGGSGLLITVDSNKAWGGSVLASENSGTSASMTIASGVLRWSDATAPTSYEACQTATAFRSTAQAWKSDVPRGEYSFTQFYCLRVDWTDDPGSFDSNVTYTVAQS